MFTEYQSHVLADYHKKKAGGNLTFNMRGLTPGKFKKECLIVFDKRYFRKDDRLLRSFFNEKEEDMEMRDAIRRCDADRFRPLIYFLKSMQKGTDEKNIELLAWLTDFQPRPYQAYLASKGSGAGSEATVPGEVSVSAPLLPEQDSLQAAIQPLSLPEKAPVKRHRKAVSLLLLLIVSGAGTFLVWNIFNREKCMYWADEHYERVSCDENAGDRLIIALDTGKLTRFKKIIRPDTLTEYSVKKVWYVKINGKIEFFTADGFHPIHIERKLHPMTAYILNKYILTKPASALLRRP